MRLYRAICAWLEASAAAMSEPEEFYPEGAGPHNLRNELATLREPRHLITMEAGGMRAKTMGSRCMYVAITFYAITVALGLGGFVLAAYGRTLEGTFMGAGAFLSAVLSFLTARASIRWRRLPHTTHRLHP